MQFLSRKVAGLYHEICNLEPIWKFLNRRAVNEWKKENAELDDKGMGKIDH